MHREDPMSKAQASAFAALMINNVAQIDRKVFGKSQLKFFVQRHYLCNIGRGIGLRNREFANSYGPQIIAALGADGSKLAQMSYNQFVDAIRDVYLDINER